MSVNNLTYNPLLTITKTAGEDLPANRFVGYDGNLCAANEVALGTTELAWSNGEKASIIVEGIVILESASTFFAGDDVCTGADGKAVAQAGSNPVVGKALSNASSGGYVQVLLIH